jgi:hypothetical protein
MNFFLFTTTCLLAYNAYLLLKDKEDLSSGLRAAFADPLDEYHAEQERKGERNRKLQVFLHKTMPVGSKVKLSSYGKVKILHISRYDALGEMIIMFKTPGDNGCYTYGDILSLEYDEFRQLMENEE